MASFIYKYFIQPIETSSGYNIVNTLVYAILFIAALYLIKPLLHKIKIKADRKFFYSLIPVMLSGGVLRVLQDMALIPSSYWFVTPGIYILTFCITIVFMLTSQLIEKEFKYPYYKTFTFLNCCFLLTNLFLLGWGNFSVLFSILGLAALVSGATIYFNKEYGILPLKSTPNKLIMAAHVLDGCASFIGVEFIGLFEQHVLPTFLMNSVGPWIMVPVKLFVILIVLKVVDSETRDKEWLIMLKVALLVLGLGPGVRDTLLAYKVA